MEARSHSLSMPAHGRARRRARGRSLVIALYLAGLVALALTIVIGGRGANEPPLAAAVVQPVAPAFVPTGFGAEYDLAVGQLVTANHALEARQARLSVAVRRNAAVTVVERLRSEVRVLERDYARAVRALAAAD